MKRTLTVKRAAIVASIVVVILAALGVRNLLQPSPAQTAASGFFEAWTRGDLPGAYTYLDTSIDRTIFVDAVRHSVFVPRNIQQGRVLQQDDQHAVVSYSAEVPDAGSAVVGIVIANRLRYGDTCSAALAQETRFVRIDDTLHLQRNDKGEWKVGLGGSTDFSQSGARLFILAFDLTPEFIWGHLSASLDPSASQYDDQTLVEALTVYNDDLGATTDANRSTRTSDVQRLLATIVGRCGNSVSG